MWGKNEINKVVLIVFFMELDKLILKVRSNIKSSRIALKILNRKKEVEAFPPDIKNNWDRQMDHWYKKKGPRLTHVVSWSAIEEVLQIFGKQR